jgi:Ca2+-binding RTX toxin-like protein
MVQTNPITAQAQPSGDIVLTPPSVSETAFENDPAATLSVSGEANGSWVYEILADSSGGAFRIEGDRLVVADNARLDFETAPEVTVTIRATNSSGQSHTETMTIAVTDEAIERRYSAGDEFVATETEETWDSGVMTVALAGGGFALIWGRFDSSTNDNAVLVRYFDADGTPASDEIVLLSGEFLTGLSTTPLAQGGFLLTHTVDNASGTGSIIAQAYDEAGNAVGPSMSTASAGNFPVVVQLSSGGYAIAWAGGLTIHAQRFDSAGAPSGPEIVIEADSSFEPIDMAATADGGFAVTWMETPEFFGQPYEVKAQFFDSAGAPSGPPVTVSSGLKIETPTLVALADGSFVLGWAEYLGGNMFQLKALPIGSDGLASGPSVTLATYKAESQFGPEPSFAAHPDGGFVAMWPDAEDYPNNRIYHRFTGQQFDSSGTPIGPEFDVAVGADGGDIAVLADGTISAAWYGPDSHGQGVWARVYSPADERQATAGDDVIYGDEGANWIEGLGGNDSLYGLGGDDELVGRSGNDRLRGGDGDDLLRGGRGNDFLDGGAGRDELRGGYGHDFYVVDNEGDRVIERSDAGWDEIRTTLASFSLADLPNVEGLSSGSDIPHDFRGNGADNFIGGGAGADLIRLNDGGEDVARGDPGNDVIYFGATLSAGDVADGGEGRDAIVLQGNVTAVLADTSLVGIESISIQSGANPNFGDTANNHYDYDITMADGNVLAGQQLIVNAQSLRAGEDFTFDGSAESDGRFLVYGGHGADILKGGDGADIFFFEGQRWGPGDRVDGGAGRDALVISAGSGLTHVAFGATSLVGIESISLNNHFATDPSQKPSYELVLHNGNVAPGATLIVNGSSLGAGQVVKIDGHGVQGGNLILFGGGGHDTLTGGGGADLIVGGSGADALTGGSGADVFRYDSAADSVAGQSDLIGDFRTGLDRIDLSRIDANTLVAGDQAFVWIGASAFSGVAGQLRSFESGGYRWIEGDTNGDRSADLVIALQIGTAPLVQGDFLL